MKKKARLIAVGAALALALVAAAAQGGVARNAANRTALAPAAQLAPTSALCPVGCAVPKPGQVPKGITVAFGNGGVGFDFLDEQSRILHALAAKYGWKVLEINNNANGPTAVNNVDKFVAAKVNYIIEFNIDSTVNPVICAKTQAAGIPVVTEAIAGPCEYFTSANDHTTGVQAGLQLGEYAKQHWNCKPDLVLLAASSLVGDASPLRVGGDIDGIKKVCPHIPNSTFVQFQMNNNNDIGVGDARNALLAHASAKKILAGGLNDLGVTQAITAAEQLHRADQLWAWGGDGSALEPNADPHLHGSIQFFLEAGIVPAFEIVLDLAAKKPVTQGFSPQNPTLLAETCPMTMKQGLSIPNLQQRGTEEVAAFGKKTPAQLFCPSYKVAVSVQGKGRVVSAPAGVSCPGKCSASFSTASNAAVLSSVALRAVPAKGYAFARWSGSCKGQKCSVSLTQNATVEAVFKKRK